MNERFRSMTMRLHQLEEMLSTVQKKVNTAEPSPKAKSTRESDIGGIPPQLEQRLDQIQMKIDGINPAFLITMETRLEALQGDLGELRSLYSSPTSQLNLVLDGLLKKVKDLEGGDATLGGTARLSTSRKSEILPSSMTSPMGRNDSISYRKLTQGRAAVNEPGGGSALASAAMMQLGSASKGGPINN